MNKFYFFTKLQSFFKFNEILLKVEECKKKVCEDLGPVQKIFENTFEDMKEGRYKHDVPLWPSMKNRFYNARKRYLDVNRLGFSKLEDVQVPKAFNYFLLCEDGTTDKILIFASNVKKNHQELCRKAVFWRRHI